MDLKEQLAALEDQLKLLKEQHPGQCIVDFKAKFDQIFPPLNNPGSVEISQSSNSESIGLPSDIANAISNMNFASAAKLATYTDGENFSRFCEKFIDYCNITNVPAQKAYSLFMQNVDDITYETLKTVKLTLTDKLEIKRFTSAFKAAIYDDESFVMKNQVINCEQKEGESIKSYAFRLRELACCAFDSREMQDEMCLIAFVKGVRNEFIRRELAIKHWNSFQEAISQATKFEKYDTLLQNAGQILKNNSQLEQTMTHDSSEGTYNRNLESDKHTKSRYGLKRSETTDRLRTNTIRNKSRSSGDRFDHHTNRKKFSNSNKYSRSSHDFICFSCGYRGHVRQSCPYLILESSGKNRGKLENDCASKNGNNSISRPGDNIRNVIIQGYCVGRPVNYFLDTGATTSLVATRIVHMNGLAAKIEPTRTIVTGLSGKVVPMRGEVSLPINIGGYETNHTFIVSDTLDSDFLLGIDIMKKLKMCIDIPNRQVKLQNVRVPFMRQPLSLQKRYKVKLQKTVTIPAGTACFVQGKFPAPDHNQNYEGMIEPYHNLPTKSQIFVTGTMSYSTRNCVPVHVVNVTDGDITIYKNQLIGFIEPLPKMGDAQTETVKRVKGQNNDFYDATLNLERLPNACSIEETIKNGKWDNPAKLIDQLKINELHHVPKNFREDLKSLVTEYSHCFARNRFDLGAASFYEAQLHERADAVPTWIPSRPVAYKIKPQLDNEIQNLLDAGQISPCKYSLYNSAVFMVKKPHSDSMRFVMDARSLNKNLIVDNYELPKIKKVLDRLSETKILTSLDFLSSFTQIGLKKECRPLTAFCHAGKRYMFNKLIMGTTSASSIFSRAMALLFQRIPFKNLLLYIDDICVCSDTYPEHLRRLRFTLDRLTFGNLKLNPAKCKLMQSEISWLGMRLSEKGVSIDPNKVNAITNLPSPTGVRQLQKLIGMVNYHRQFIPNMASIMGPLYDLLKKGKKFQWSRECENSFSTLKKALASSPVLALPDVDDTYNSWRVTIDASVRGLGMVLSQYCPKAKRHRVVSYHSKSVPKHLRKWGATRLEFLTLHTALTHWSLYLKGCHVEVLTDCKALLNIDTIFSKGNAYMQRRIADLSGFRFTIRHVSGKSEEIQVADYLSRYSSNHSERSVGTQTDSPVMMINHQSSQSSDKNESENAIDEISSNVVDGESDSDDCSIESVGEDDHPKMDEVDFEYNVPELPEGELELSNVRKVESVLNASEADLAKPVTLTDIRQNYKNDKILGEVMEWINSKSKPDKLNPRHVHKELLHYWRDFRSLKLSDGLLKKKVVDPDQHSKTKWVTVVPFNLIERIMFMSHNSIASCHSGVANTLDQCRRRFYFFKMSREVKLYTAACLTCQRSKRAQRHLKAPLKPIICNHFNQCIQIDHLEPSKKKTPRGYVALLNIVDKYSSYLVSIPVRSTKAEHTARVLIDHWFTRFGIPEKIMHDQGSGFESSLFKGIMKILKIKNVRSTPWKSSTQGHIERANGKMNACFRAVLENDNFHNWDLYAGWIAFSINGLRTSRTGYSPHFLVFGRQLRSLQDLFTGDTEDKDDSGISESNIHTSAYDLYKRVRNTTRTVREITKRRAKYMCDQWNSKTLGPFFNSGDYCMVLVNVPKHKYSYKWAGPYRIVERISDHNYVIMIQGIRKVISITKMKRYVPNHYSRIPDDQKAITEDGSSSKGPGSDIGNIGHNSNSDILPRGGSNNDSKGETDSNTIIIFNRPPRPPPPRPPRPSKSRQTVTDAPNVPSSPLLTSTPRSVAGTAGDITLVPRPQVDAPPTPPPRRRGPSDSSNDSKFFTPVSAKDAKPKRTTIKAELLSPPVTRNRSYSTGNIPSAPSLSPVMVRDRTTGLPIPVARQRPLDPRRLLPRAPLTGDPATSPRVLPQSPVHMPSPNVGTRQAGAVDTPASSAGPSNADERTARRAGLRSKDSLKKTKFFGSPVSSLKRTFSKGKGDRK